MPAPAPMGRRCFARRPFTLPQMIVAAAMLGLAPIAAGTPPELLAPVVGPAAPAALSPAPLRSRPVAVDQAVLAALAPAEAASLRLSFFDDASFSGALRPLAAPGGGMSWAGRTSGGGWMALHRRGDRAAACAWSADGRVFALRGAAGGSMLACELDVGALPPCAGAETAAATDPAQDGLVTPLLHDLGEACDDGSTIDLLVLHTPAVTAALGGHGAVAAELGLIEASVNLVYAASEVHLVLRCVSAAEIDYLESGQTVIDLLRLQNPADGLLDGAHGLRSAAGADLVTLLLADGDACGRAMLAVHDDGASEAFAFSVVLAGCAAANFTLAHELGHNQGCLHDRAADGSSDGAHPFAHGYVDPHGAFRTVLAVDGGAGIPRIPHLSNPEVLVGGRPTGVAIDESDSAHNALAVRATALTVANFRCRDCDDDGIGDDLEIAGGTARDDDGDGVPDACELGTGCAGDLDGDDLIGATELLAVLLEWGCTGACSADLDGDGSVGVNDIVTLLMQWGGCAGGAAPGGPGGS